MDLRARVDGSREELLGELNEFLRMPSISAREDENGDFRNCAGWVAGKLEEAGAEASIMETEGHPVVFAEIGAGPNDAPLLRPLRRAAARAPGSLGERSVRAYGQGRRPLRPRRR